MVAGGFGDIPRDIIYLNLAGSTRIIFPRTFPDPLSINVHQDNLFVWFPFPPDLFYGLQFVAYSMPAQNSQKAKEPIANCQLLISINKVCFGAGAPWDDVEFLFGFVGANGGDKSGGAKGKASGNDGKGKEEEQPRQPYEQHEAMEEGRMQTEPTPQRQPPHYQDHCCSWSRRLKLTPKRTSRCSSTSSQRDPG